MSCAVLVYQSNLFPIGLTPTSPLHVLHPPCTLSGHDACLNVTKKTRLHLAKNRRGLLNKA